MTDKEIFLQIKTHLLSQGKQCMAEYTTDDGKTITGCAYRSPEGLKCAVGCIIKDEYYTPELEGKNIGGAGVQQAVRKSLGLESLPRSTFWMLHELQGMHDCIGVKYWEGNLTALEHNGFNSDGSFDKFPFLMGGDVEI